MSSSQAQPPPGVDPTKFARRAIGRSPEEHAALERVLAERRRRRGVTDSGIGGGSSSRTRSRSPAVGPSDGRADLAQQRRALERREREFEQQRREHLLRLEIQEHDLLQRRRRQEEQLAARERELELAALAQARRAAGGLAEAGDEGRAMPAVSVAQRRAALLAPFRVTDVRRRAKGKSKGAGWHRRGYRDDGGYMWVNVKEGEECTKGQDIYESSTLADFVREVQSECRYLLDSLSRRRPVADSISTRSVPRGLRLWVSGAAGYYGLGPALPQEVSSTASHRSRRGRTGRRGCPRS